MKNRYFKRKNGSNYPISKEEIYKNINVYNQDTFLYILEELDIPWIPKYWDKYVKQSIRLNHNISSAFGKYYNYMQLFSFKNFGYKDSYLFQEK